MNKLVELQWKRPKSTNYPNIWHTFKAKDIDSDALVEYRIEDLCESRSEDAINMMRQFFCKDEPLCVALGMKHDLMIEEEFARLLYGPIIKQKMALVCYKSGSNDIIGLNMNYVTCEDDKNFYQNIKKQFKCEENIKQFDLLALLSANFNTFEFYGVDKYLSSAGLAVDSKYRGRSIGEQFLRIRKEICEEFDIKLTSTIFTSDFSNRIADNVGFTVNTTISYDTIREKYPEFGLGEMKHSGMSIKSILF